MQLLVSVANAVEARYAVEGGADLIDAKDPLTGALGAVSISTLQQIQAVVAGRRAITAALGDASDEESIERDAFDYGRAGARFVKVGFAGITDLVRVETLIAAAVRGTRATTLTPCDVIAVAYADTGGVTSVDPTPLVAVAARAGAAGVLLDTALKAGPALRMLVTSRMLESWVATAHRAGLIAALAGKLTLDDLSFVACTGADIAGVRGAACAHGRSSSVVEENVRLLCAELLATAAR